MTPVRNNSSGNRRNNSSADATRRAIEGLRQKVFRHDLLPGEHIRQEDLAEQMGISRGPLREALTALETEGIVRHVPNQGFFVVRLRASELEQVYYMRELLESAILQNIERPDDASLSVLEQTNDDLSHALTHGPISTILDENREFHFHVFDLSPLSLITAQVLRLWNLSESYRASYLALPDVATRERILAEHREMIRALADFDIEALIDVANRHRRAGQATVERLLLAQEPVRDGTDGAHRALT
jgi:DNA-binding GntR family transcriptional regulator